MGHDARQNPTARAAASRVSTRAYDRLGRTLAEGDLVVLLDQGTILWRVARVGPSLHPGAPVGMVELSLVAVLESGIPGGQPLPNLVQVQTQPPTAHESEES